MPAIITKALTAKVNVPAAGALSSDPAGTFEALVSRFGNEDYAGDIVEAGAFADSLAQWAQKGRPIPVVWSHQYGDVNAFLGYYSEARETDEGLYLKGHLDLNHPTAARVYQLMQQGLVVEFSWSGEVLEYEVIEPEDPANEWSWWFAGIKMLKVDLWEAGPCFKGMNPETQLISIKAADTEGPLRERILRSSMTPGDLEAVKAFAEARKTITAPAPVDGPQEATEAPESAPEDAPEDETPSAPVPAPEAAEDGTTVQRASAETRALARLELALITTP